MLERSRRKDKREITFVLPADQPTGQVSVVGDFNDWKPGVHPFTERADGTRAVSVTLPGERHYGFRYLAAGDYWFDEAHADGHDGQNSILHT
ncbi:MULTISPECIES: isoamylase early set domain-containing protein [unclassified Streptomyces]|uniref:isoamylase early set domain-containing protein n=1 Tax=unclassified Streptomyces TaxID=2593676 RepID=UPI002E0F2129|nr:isoamylase early set domain-containing protein [Streptomyces sp. NBC_01197]WSS52922.1 isoamylase early set domain-containing protein [Streptomyces sp. NBC_01180]